MSDQAEARIASHDLTLTQWVTLTALWRRDGMTNNELAEYSEVTPAALSKTLGRMEKKDLVKREMDGSDRRVQRVFLTPKSKKLKPLINFYSDMNELILAEFGKQEKELLFDMLNRIIHRAGSLENRES
ncbi:MAG: MarR family transcriptional regulator [Rhodospirillaceae bacterium]|nr:MarR family transcriptional regulator [Rhodospirillaceae bacterium]MBT7956464.1 MarR family transcriptional regulator [Rhodospirillaceae bacterium]